jgi:hypothetical protein
MDTLHTMNTMQIQLQLQQMQLQLQLIKKYAYYTLNSAFSFRHDIPFIPHHKFTADNSQYQPTLLNPDNY